MKRRLSAAFVVTVSMGALGCHKTQAGNSSCEPPDCHANPPPQPTPEPTPNANPPATPDPTPTINANPPAHVDAGFRLPTRNPPPLRSDGGLLGPP